MTKPRNGGNRQTVTQTWAKKQKGSVAMSFLDSARRALSNKSDDYYDDAEYDYEQEEYEDEYEDYEEEEPKRSFFSFLNRKSNNDYEEYEDYEPSTRSFDTGFSKSANDRYSKEFVKPSSTTPQRTSLAGVEVTVHYPESLDDATKIIREVKVNKITIFDISTIASDDEARRVVDYIGGAAEGMECPFKRLCPSIFCIAPKGVTLDVRKQRY